MSGPLLALRALEGVTLIASRRLNMRRVAPVRFLGRRVAARRRTRLAAAPAMLVIALGLGASTAHASEASTIIERCIHGGSLSGFSQNGYREALAHMPTEVSEYSECSNLIHRAELAAAEGGGAASNVPIPLTPAEQRAVLSAHRNGSAPVLVGAQPIRPGVVHASIASAVSTLPHSLFAVLAFLLAGAIILAGGEVRKRVRARHES